MLKILHLSDIQMEIRRNAQRHDEYSDALAQVVAAVKADPTISKIAMTGDMFEFCSVTETERLMFIKFVQELESIPTIDEIVITSGNHDLKQRFNDIQINGVSVVESSVMDGLIETFIKHPKVRIFTKSGFYGSNTIPNLNWGVWAHEHKFDGQFEKYNPWNSISPSPKEVIELYHDDFAGAVNFNGQLQKGCEDAAGFPQFKALTILAGHIHNPQQFTSGDQLFTYASSTVMRDFGEGDYYLNDKRTVDGNHNHGFYVHEIDENNNFKTVSSTFHKVVQHTTRTTIMIDKNFDYENIDQFKLLDVSKNKNLFRIYVIGNEAKYHEHSQKLIETIRSQAPNAEISTEIDASSIFAETGEELDLELDKLVSEEQILEMAIPFIKRRIRSTKTILEEDKEKAENTTIEMFKSQLTKLRRNIVRNNIGFKNLNISNFLSFEDNVEIDFTKLKSLVKISGTNGIGKTNIMKVLKWLIDDVIDSAQSKNTVTVNAADVFNDKRLNTNIVSVDFTFTNNGTIYSLNKKVERFFKARSKDITVHNWKDHYSNIQISKTLRIQTIDSDTTLVDIDVINAELKSIFGTVQDLEALLFTNANLLDRLVKSKPEVLADQIMHHLGLRYFSDMTADYDNLREEKLKGLAKPSESIDSLVVQLTELKDAKENGAVQKESLTVQKEELDVKAEKLNSEITVLSSKLHQVVDTLETIDSSIEYNQTNLTDVKNALVRGAADYEKESDALLLINDDFNDRIELELNSKQPLTAEIETEANKVTVKTAEIETVKVEAREKANAVKSEIQKSIDDKYSEKSNTLRDTVQAKESEKTKIADEVRAVKDGLISEIQTEKTKLSSELAKTESELTAAQSKIKTDEGMLNIYQKSTTCNDCKRELTGDALLEIQERIKEREKAISDTKVLENDLSVLKTSITTQLSQAKFTDMDTFVTEQLKATQSEKLTKLRSLVDEIKSINESIAAIAAEKSAEELLIGEKVKAHVDVVKAIEVIGAKNKELELLVEKRDHIKDINTEKILAIDTTIAKIRTEKQVYENSKKLLAERKEQNDTFKTNIEKLQLIITGLEADKVKLAENEKTNADIKVLKDQQLLLNDNIKEIGEKLYQIVIKLESANINLDRIEKDIEDSIKYRIMDASLSIYKTFISKKGLNTLVFDAVSKKLNVHMNDLLQDSPYKLSFINGVLQLIDSNNPELPVMRSAPAFSGMQIILGGLSLFYVLRNTSLGTRYDAVFIDEVSGPLNDGKELTYNAIDYKEQLVKMIAKMRDTSKVFIVDHVLDFYDGSVLEVYPSAEGANIKEIDVPQT